MVHRYPAAVKAFYMKPDPERADLALGVDVLAPEGYGEIIGGGERLADLDLLLQRIKDHNLPQEAFEWYLDLRRYGTVPHGGFGMGIERVVSWICKLDHVRETIPYPRMLVPVTVLRTVRHHHGDHGQERVDTVLCCARLLVISVCVRVLCGRALMPEYDESRPDLPRLPKNLVDSEVMLGLTQQAGHELTNDPSAADVLVVNTCAFIDKAKQESIDTILEMARHKTAGSCQRLVVTGCLAERYREELKKEIPEIDAVLGTGEVPQIVGAIAGGAMPLTFHRTGAPGTEHRAPCTAH